MSHDVDERSIGRRRFLAGLGTVGGVSAIGGASAFGGTSDGGAVLGSTKTSDAPEVEWRRDYEGPDASYEIGLHTLRQTDDGGFVLGGSGTPITKTGGGAKQFTLVRADSDGSMQWIAFADDGSEETEDVSCSDLVQTDGGAYVLVGHATNPAESATDRVGGEVAQATKLTADGDVAWVHSWDAFEADESSDTSDAGFSDNALFFTALAREDGGVLVGGTFEGDAWLVEIDASGETVWRRTYDGFGVQRLWTDPDGRIHAVVDGDDVFRAHVLNDDGTVAETTTLAVDYEQTPHNLRFVGTADGGYAYTGRDAGQENVVLGKLAADGTRAWREEYDGPYEGSDWARHVLQTDDGGYALAGYMQAATSGAITPAVLRTDGDGTERWRWLFTESSASDVAALVETDDGGYACLLGSMSNALVKLGGDAESGGDSGPTNGNDDGTETDTSPANGSDNGSEADTGPTNASGDTLLEDVNGDGEASLSDVLTYVQNQETDSIRNDPEHFDFDSDGEAGDTGDALALLDRVFNL